MSTASLPSGLDGDVARYFDNISVRGKVLAEYIWIGGSGRDLRSKSRVLKSKPQSVEDLPISHFDGTFTGQAQELCSTVFIKPRMFVPDPFRGGDHILVLCDTFSAPSLQTGFTELKPHPSNNRAPCEHVMQSAALSEPAFSIEQQYTLLDPATKWPMGWPERASISNEANQGCYCGVGMGSSIGREFAESHFRACLYAGIPITGSSSEVVPGQRSYSIGPCCGLEIGDQLWLSRYILLRCTEKFSITASLDPKPVPGDWSGSGAFVKYSTKETREARKGWSELQRHIHLLEENHLKHLMVYGTGNLQRLLSQPKLCSALQFSWGLDNRSASVRIPLSAFLHGKGWLEDRRPASNMDPYLVSMMLVCSTLGIHLPLATDQGTEMCAESPSEETQRSSAILSELDRQDSFAPDTPPQNMSLLASECSSAHHPMIAACPKK